MFNRFLPFLFLLSLLATCIEVDMSVPGFPDIARDFNVAEGTIHLTIAYNFLGFCMSALIYGPLSESYGRRKVMLCGNAIMTIGAIGCIYAPTINFLIFLRFIQGLGASTSVVLVFAMIVDLYESKKAMRLIGVTNAFLSCCMAVAPVIGGFINEAVGWRGNYVTVAILSILVWLLQYYFLPESKKELTQLNLQKTFEDYKKLFFNPAFMSAALAPSFLFSSYMAYIASSAFLYINAFGLSRIGFVMHQAAIIGSFAIMSLFAGQIIQTLGAKKTTTAGMSLCCLSAFLLLSFGYIGSTLPAATTLAMVIFGIGFAICYPVIFTNSLSIFPEVHGTASSIIMALRALLVFFFTSFTGHIYNNELIQVAIPIAIGIVVAFFLMKKTTIYRAA